MADEQLFDLTYSKNDIDNKDLSVQIQVTENADNIALVSEGVVEVDNKMRYEERYGVNREILVDTGKYKIDNTVSSTLPDGVSALLDLKVIGFTDTATLPNKIVHHLTDRSNGRKYESYTDAYDVATPVWSSWVEINQHATNTELLVFKDMTGETITRTAGQLSYESGRLKFYGKHLDAPIRIGSTITFEMKNNTGSTIPKLTPVSWDGLDNGMSMIRPTFIHGLDTARVLGVTGMDIPNGETGIVVHQGLIENVDTVGMTEGVAYYASDTTEGALELVAPDIATQVGVCLRSDASVGRFFVAIRNTIVLPISIASIKGQTDGEYTLSANVQQVISGYSKELSVIEDTNMSSGTIGVRHAGVYRFTFEFSGTLSDEEINMNIELYDVTNDIALESFDFNSGRGSDPVLVPMTQTFTRPFDVLADNTVYAVKVKSETNETLIIDNCSFTIESIHVR